MCPKHGYTHLPAFSPLLNDLKKYQNTHFIVTKARHSIGLRWPGIIYIYVKGTQNIREIVYNLMQPSEMVGTSDTTRRCHMSTLGHCLLPPYLLCVLEHSSALRKCTWLGGSRLLVRVLSTLGRSDILAVLATLATFSNLSKQQSKQKPVDASWCQASSALSKIVALASQPTKMASTHLCPSIRT